MKRTIQHAASAAGVFLILTAGALFVVPAQADKTKYPVVEKMTHKGYTDPAPALGQNNTDIYSGLLGLTEGQIAELRDRQII